MKTDDLINIIQTLQFMAGPNSGLRIYRSKQPFFVDIKGFKNDNPRDTMYYSIMFDAMAQNYEDGTLVDNQKDLRHTVILAQFRKHNGNIGNPRFFNIDEAGIREFKPNTNYNDPNVDRDMRQFSARFEQIKHIPLTKNDPTPAPGTLIEEPKKDEEVKPNDLNIPPVQ